MQSSLRRCSYTNKKDKAKQSSEIILEDFELSGFRKLLLKDFKDNPIEVRGTTVLIDRNADPDSIMKIENVDIDVYNAGTKITRIDFNWMTAKDDCQRSIKAIEITKGTVEVWVKKDAEIIFD